MYSNIIIKGQVLKVLEKEYQGNISYSIQFMTQDEKKGFSIIGVKVEPDLMIQGLKENDNVEIPLKISFVNNNIYYSATNKIKVLGK